MVCALTPNCILVSLVYTDQTVEGVGVSLFASLTDETRKKMITVHLRFVTDFEIVVIIIISKF